MAHDITKDVIGCKEFEGQDFNKSGEPLNFYGSITEDNHIVNKKYVDDSVITDYWKTTTAQTGLTGDKTGTFDLTTTGDISATSFNLCDNCYINFGDTNNYQIRYDESTANLEFNGSDFNFNGDVTATGDVNADYINTTGTITLDTTDKNEAPQLVLNSKENYVSQIAFRQDDNLRWVIRTHNVTYGNNYVINRHNSGGSLVETSFQIDWSNGDITISNQLKVKDSSYLGDGGTTDYTKIDSDGVLTMHGDARVDKCVTIRVGGFKAPGSNPADLIDLGIAQAYAFDDGTQEYICTEITLPLDMDRTVAPKLEAYWSATDTTGNAVWQMEYLYRAPNEDMTASAQETITGDSSPSGTANGLVVAELTGIDLPSSTDRVILIRISRKTSDAGDTLTGDARLSAIKFCYTANKLGTAL